VGAVLRRHVVAGARAARDARTLLDESATLVDERNETSPSLRAAAWGLHDRVSFYDALYVALAKALDLPLLTADARLARSAELPCALELVGAA
jgi:predicted nucleic acid-binding protein